MDDGLQIQPSPAIPLEYFDRQSESWIAIQRWGTWVSAAYGALMMAAATPQILYNLLPPLGYASQTTLVSMQMMTYILPGAMSALALFVSAILVLRGQQPGRVGLIWSCAALVGCAVLQFGIYVMMIAPSFTQQRLGSTFVIYQISSQFFAMLKNAFVPMLLITLFRKREIRAISD